QRPWSVRLPSSKVLPADLEVVVDGRASPQDEAAMRVVELLEPKSGERILDVCAAPGGKTCHIAEMMGDDGTVIACDRLPNRLARVASNARRLGLTSVTTEDVLPAEDELFDRVLVDAPCSGLGTLRRHPEIRWRLTDDDIAELTRTQHSVLLEGARRVRSGGTLVYAVCTVTKAEGEDQVATLRDDFEVEEVLRTGPHQLGAPDGFFAARLVRR
ncbi:MAG: SAM-dependent methyltransferase, partial [Myxococcota bacterium]